MTDNNPKVSVVILNWNKWEVTGRCLESLRQLDYPDFEVILVDNASDSPPPDRLISIIPGTILLRNIITKPELVGTFHLTCSGEATWFDLACELFKHTGINRKVIPCTTDEYPGPALRPRNSRLEKMALRLHGLQVMPDWRDALIKFLNANQI